MIRAAILSVVLTLAVGQNAAVLCGVWCHSDQGMADACEHHAQTTTPAVVANDDCAVDGNSNVFVREDSRRSASSPDFASTVALARLAFTPPDRNLSAHEPDRQLLLEPRRLVLALRI